MKEEYCRAVARKLDLSRKDKQRVLEDLADTFEAGREHGQTEKQIAEHLGPPEDFAREINFQLGGKRKRLCLLLGCFCGVLCLAFAATAVFLKGAMPGGLFPQDAIGGAVTITAIEVVGNPGISPLMVLVLLSLAAGIVAVILLRRFKSAGRNKQ